MEQCGDLRSALAQEPDAGPGRYVDAQRSYPDDVPGGDLIGVIAVGKPVEPAAGVPLELGPQREGRLVALLAGEKPGWVLLEAVRHRSSSPAAAGNSPEPGCWGWAAVKNLTAQDGGPVSVTILHGSVH